MSITGFFLRNRYAIWAMVVATVIAGTAAYFQIPVRLFPDTAPPLVNVVTAWPGATASDVHRDLGDVLETEFASLDGVARSSSTSQDNLSVIQLEFQYGTDVRLAAVDVQNAVSRILGDLPQGAELPRVLSFSTADRPIYTVGLQSESLLDARRLAEDVIAPRLQSSKGVAAVDVFGGQIPSVLVDVDPQLAEAHHIALPQIAQVLRSNNISMPAGRIRAQKTETMLRVDQRRERVEDLEQLPVQLKDGSQLRIGNVATIYRGAEQDDSWFSINGERAIAIQVFRSQNANTVDVVGRVRKEIDLLKKKFPELKFIDGEESASFTEQSVSNLLANVWQALLLASVILFLFLGRARAALVTAFTMPLAFGLTFFVMWKLDMEFNMVTLTAVILAVGMVVDASVVVLENIIRLRDEGLSPEDAAQKGTDQVWGPVLAGTATTLVVLIPLLSLEGFVGKVFGPLATTLLIAFSSSVLVALVLVPILSLQVKDGGIVEKAAATFSSPFRVTMEWISNAYIYVLTIGLKWRSLVLLVAFASFVAGVVGLRSLGMDLLPRMDGGTFSVSLQTPSGTSLQETTKVVQRIETLIREAPEVLLVQSQAGFEPGMKFSGGGGVIGPTQGFLSVSLSPRTSRERSIWQIEAALRKKIALIPGIASAVVKEIGNTAKPTTLAPIVARISGPDPLVLEKLGNEVLERLERVPALVHPTLAWKRDMRRIVVRVDEREAASHGQSSRSIAQSLAMGTEGVDAGNWTPELKPAEPIVVRYRPQNDPTVRQMLSWPFFLPSTGDPLPLRSVAKTETITEQGLYSSIDLNPVLDILAGVGDRPLSFVVADAEKSVQNMNVPQGYRVHIDGESNDLKKSKSSILGALSVSVLAVYLLLVAQFRSWIHPVTVMMAVPLSISGVSLALWSVGKPVSMPVMVGLVLLVGTVVNNSILLVDVIRELRLKGIERREAIREGVRARFRPIMMTSLSTIVGMLPLAMELALGAERFSPLATAVIGGLLVSTLLTMIVIPVLYDAADSFSSSFGKGGNKNVAAASVATLLVAGSIFFVPSLAQAQESSATSITLKDAWALTLSHPAAQSASLQIQAAELSKTAANRRFFPRAEVTGRAAQSSWPKAGQLDMGLTLPDGTPAPPVQFGDTVQQHFSVRGAITQPLYAGGALIAGKKATTAQLKAAKHGQETTEGELWYSLVQSWYGLAVADELVDIREIQLKSAAAREESLERLYTQGRATELDYSAVALKRAEAKQLLVEAQSAALTAKVALESFLNHPVQRTPIDVLAKANSLSTMQKGGQISPALARAQALAQAAEARATAAKSPLLPNLVFKFRAEYSNPNYRYFPIQDKFQGAWDAALILNWKIDAGATYNEAQSARRSAEAAQAQSRALERQIEVELASAKATLELTPTQLKVAKGRVKIAKRAVATTLRAYEQGRSTADQVGEREADLALARAAQQRTALNALLAHERLRVLSGSYGPK